MSTWDDKPNDYEHAVVENERLRAALQEITDHFAAVMGGPMIAGTGIIFENGVEGIPTIKAAREVLKCQPVC